MDAATFTAPNGVRYAVTLEEDGLFIHVDAPAGWQAGEILYEPNCMNEGWVKVTLRPAPIEAPRRRTEAPEGECRYCDENRGVPFTPYHDPSPYCESGKRPHCTCDICF